MRKKLEFEHNILVCAYHTDKFETYPVSVSLPKELENFYGQLNFLFDNNSSEQNKITYDKITRISYYKYL